MQDINKWLLKGAGLCQLAFILMINKGLGESPFCSVVGGAVFAVELCDQAWCDLHPLQGGRLLMTSLLEDFVNCNLIFCFYFYIL